MVIVYEDLFMDAKARRTYLKLLDETIESARKHGLKRDYIGLVNYRRRLLQELEGFMDADAA